MSDKLQVGDIAPQFIVKDAFGKKIDLKSYAKHKTLISFFRYAGCPWCNLALHKLTQEFPILQKNGMEAIVFLQSDKDSIAQQVYERHTPKPPFAIVPDTTRSIYDLYGVQDSKVALAKSVRKLPQWVDTCILQLLP